MKDLLETLRRDGIARGMTLPRLQANAVLAHLAEQPVYNAHVVAKSTSSQPTPEQAARIGWPMFCHDMEAAVTAPHLFEAALAYLDLARAYFDGEQPRLYSMNAFWTQPSGAVYQDTHGWHRDGDDRKQLVLFMFGTDVFAPDEGAHRYQRGTHRIADADLGYDFRAPHANVETVLGARGTTFLADTGGLHIGLRPNRRRMLAWARFGVSDPPQSYVWDKLAPVPRSVLGSRYPTDPALREAIQLVVQ